MFDNIGSKLKKLAKVSTITGIIGSAIIGLFVIADQPLIGFLILALGSLLSWFGSFTIYGLGQLIENTDELVKQGRMAAQPPIAPAPQPAQKQPMAGPPAENGKVACPACGTVQNANRSGVCLHCGQPLTSKKS